VGPVHDGPFKGQTIAGKKEGKSTGGSDRGIAGETGLSCKGKKDALATSREVATSTEVAGD